MIPSFMEPGEYYCPHKSLPLGPVLRKASLVHILTVVLFKHVLIFASYPLSSISSEE